MADVAKFFFGYKTWSQSSSKGISETRKESYIKKKRGMDTPTVSPKSSVVMSANNLAKKCDPSGS